MALTAYESATRLVDSAASGRVLVLGPTRRAAACVDLVCRREDALSIRAALAEDGFVGRGASLARFDDRGTVAVTVIDADDWKHSERVVEDAFARATSMAGCSRLAQAQLADELLILCRRVDDLPRVFSSEWRRTLDAALAADSTAWVVAAGRARAWHVERVLDAVKAAADEGAPISARDRSRPAAQGVLVAFSGLDGSGKSTQSRALAATLSELGYDVAIRWSRLAFSPVLAELARPVKFLLRGVARHSEPSDAPVRAYQGHRGDDADSLPTAADLAARRLRGRWPLVHHLWTLLVALVNGWEQRGAARRSLRDRKVVICDRYVLDSLAHLRTSYSAHGGSKVAEWLIRRLAPPAAVSILLDLPAEEAYRRKPEEYGVADLRAQAARYREAAQEVSAHVLDACEPSSRLAQRVAAIVWTSLP